MQFLGYKEKYLLWIKLYDFTISKLDKDNITKGFIISIDENSKCIILVVTNTYKIGIDYPNNIWSSNKIFIFFLIE